MQAYLSGNTEDPRCLVVVFLRGGADGLTLVPPVGDDTYHRARPNLRITESAAVPLSGPFGLHPALSDLQGLWREGQLAVVHATGSEDDTRSHFEAQDLMEHGGLVAGGWLGRFLRYRPREEGSSPGALSAVAVGRTLPEVLRGAPSASVIVSLDDFAVGARTSAFADALGRLYASAPGGLAAAGRDTLETLRRVERLRNDKPAASGAVYGPEWFPQGLRLVSRLIKARVGLEAATIDIGGWDSHFTQTTLIEPLMRELAAGIRSFMADLGADAATTSLIVMTEFGRRVRENSSLGTDHGRASALFVAGGGVRGGRVAGGWPGLGADSLEGPGDLPVVTNYRDALAPVLIRHGAGTALSAVFPGHTPSPLDI